MERIKWRTEHFISRLFLSNVVDDNDPEVDTYITLKKPELVMSAYCLILGSLLTANYCHLRAQSETVPT
jgi:hypothetical protein